MSVLSAETLAAMLQLPPIVEIEDEGFVEEPEVVLDSGDNNGRSQEEQHEEGTGSAVQPSEGSGDGADASGQLPDGGEKPDAGERKPGDSEDGGQEEGEPPISAERLAENEQKAATYDSLVKSLADNPAAFVQNLIERLSPEQRAAIGIAQQQTAQPQQNEAGWEDGELTEPEKFVKANRAIIADLPRYADYVNKRANTHEQYIVQALNENAALRAQISAMQELLEVKFPDAKFEGYDPKAHDAYASEVKKVVGMKKASKVETPKTPLNTGGGGQEKDLTVSSSGGNSFADLFKAVKRAQSA